MSAKTKSDDNIPDKSAGSYLAANKDPELEKRIDAMMNIDEPKTAGAPSVPVESLTSAPIESVEPVENSAPPATPGPGPEPATSGPPLLPSDKLPDLETPTIKKSKSTSKKKKDSEPLPEQEPEQVKQLEQTEPPRNIPESSPMTVSDELGLEDSSTSRAVDEIMAADADDLLAIQDRSAGSVQPLRNAKPVGSKRSNIFVRWWRNKLARNLTTLIILLGVGSAAMFPTSRYAILNAAGVQASSSVMVLDETTGQPLKNAEFTIHGQTSKTGSDGLARLNELRLGPADLIIKKAAFADLSQPVTIGWGSNPLGDIRLKAVGTQYTFTITDFVSKLPIAKAEASSGRADAQSNDKGELILTIPEVSDDETVTVQISSPSYRTETLTLPRASREAQALQLVPERKHVFVSKRSGKFDVYKTDIDGKNEQKILAGTGSERADSIALSVHETKDVAALVSNRGGSRGTGSSNVSTLTLINIKDNSTKQITLSERIQLIEWIGNKLIYVKISENAAPDSSDRHRLVSYDIDAAAERDLASSNYFNDVVAINDSIYYSPAVYQVNGAVGLFKINADGNYKRTVTDKEVWSIFRTAYDRLKVSMGQDWYELNLDNDTLTPSDAPPTTQKSRIYQDGPNTKINLWTDERDGKGVLLGYDTQTKTDKVLQTQSGLKNPIHWLDSEHVIYRVSSTQETADYVISTNGGSPQKIRDVTDTAGIDRWYYY